MTSCYELENEEDEKEAKLEKPPKNDGEALTSLEALPVCDDWRQIFSLPKEIRQQIVASLQHPKLYVDKVKSPDQLVKDVAHYAACNTAITFTDDDLLLGSKPHNRPLFVTGYIREQKVRRILVDGGSAVNIMPKSTMNDLGITVEELSKSRMVIQGFSLESQRVISMIRLELIMGDQLTSSMFHIIDSKTSYKLLVRRPWLHEHGIVASTLHQCLKYYRGGERKINGDARIFTKAESHFADAKFFEEAAAPKEMMISTIASIGESKVTKGAQATTGCDDTKQQQRNREDNKEVSETQPAKQVAGQVAASSNSMTPILRYVPKFHRRKRESPFSGIVHENAEGKAMKKDSGTNLNTLKESVTLPT